MSMKLNGITYPSEEIMMFAIGMSKDKRAVIDSATQCTTDYFGWRNAFDDMGRDREQFIEEYGFDFMSSHFVIKTCDEVCALLKDCSITNISEGYILAYLQSR